MDKPRSRTAKTLYIALGGVSLALGVIGIFLPILPTTVFLLISAWSWARSSERFYKWLINNKLLGSYISNYKDEKGVTQRQRVLTLALLWIGIGYTAVFIVSKLWLTLLLFGIAITVTIHMLMLKTLPTRVKEAV
jgi:uncharacterized protein